MGFSNLVKLLYLMLWVVVGVILSVIGALLFPIDHPLGVYGSGVMVFAFYVMITTLILLKRY